MVLVLGAGRSVRDKQLAWALGLLFGAEVLHLIASSIGLADLLESRTSDARQVAGWLDLISNLFLLGAAAFGLFAFLAEGKERTWWLRRGFLLATFGFATAFFSSVLEYSAIQTPAPEGLNLALLAACFATFVFTAGAFLAASAVRDGAMRRSAWAWGVAQLSVGVSSWAYNLAYSSYLHHGAFSRGLVIEGFGAFAAGLALFYAGSAFRSVKGQGQGWLRERERRLFLAAGALGISFLAIALGEAQRAAGTTALGYPESITVTVWILALSQLVAAAAFFCAAPGFRVAAETPG